MKIIFCKLIFTILLYLTSLQAISSGLNEKIPLYFKPTNENMLAGQNSLNIDLCDVRVKEWCAKPQRDTGLSGKNINDYISISPDIKGEWRFSWGYNINFTPKNNFLAHKTYKVTVNTKDLFPNFINFKSNIASVIKVLTKRKYHVIVSKY